MIKRYLPKSLLGRAVLILLVPVVSLQLIFAILIVQRHFDGVTERLAGGVGLEIASLLSRMEEEGLSPSVTAQAAALELELSVVDGPVDPVFRRPWYDLSGRVIQSALSDTLGRDVAVDVMQNFRRVIIDVPMDAAALRVDAPRKRMSASNPHQLIVLSVAAALLLTIISLLFLRNQVRPITRLAAAAEAFGKGRAVPYRPAGAEEVRRAGAAFLSMRARIERQIEQRMMMLSGVSHDLRTPLTRMRLALATAETPDDLAALGRDLNDMESMLDAFLNFARDSAQEEVEEVDIPELAKELVAAAKRDGSDVTLILRAEGGDGTLVARPLPLRRAIQNLLGNAERYATRSRISVTLRPRAVIVTVEDDGPGIPETERERALRPFVRLDPARNQDRGGGTGLGLTIAADAARLHGGALGLGESADLGGLMAVLTIPR